MTNEPESSPFDGVSVVGISGSLRPGSFTSLAVAGALAGAAAAGARVRMIDLRDYALVFCEGTLDDKDAPDGVMRLRAQVRQAQGIILGTPEYHGSVSGVLKNALDLMGFEEFEGKVTGLVGVSGGRIGATDAINALRTIGRALHAWVIPEQVAIAEARHHFGPDGTIHDAELAARLRLIGQQVARFSYLHHSNEVQDFLRQWETAQPNPGGLER